MTPEEQIAHFNNEITNVIQRFRMEYEIPRISAVGVLNMIIRVIQDEQIQEAEDGQD